MISRTTKLALMFAALSLCGCYDDFDSYKAAEKEVPVRNATIETLRGFCPETGHGNVNLDIVLGGYVTANDVNDNFYRTFIIDDGTGAIEIKAGINYLFSVYPEGRYVTIKTRGLTIGKYNQVMQIGMAPTAASSYDVEFFGHETVLNRYVDWNYSQQIIQPVTVNADDLTNDLCGRLVKIPRLTLNADQERLWAVDPETSQFTSSSFRIFSDSWGNEIAVQTSNYASFAQAVIPSGRVSLTGILMYGRVGSAGNMYILKLRSLDDVEEI